MGGDTVETAAGQQRLADLVGVQVAYRGDVPTAIDHQAIQAAENEGSERSAARPTRTAGEVVDVGEGLLLPPQVAALDEADEGGGPLSLPRVEACPRPANPSQGRRRVLDR